MKRATRLHRIERGIMLAGLTIALAGALLQMLVTTVAR